MRTRKTILAIGLIAAFALAACSQSGPSGNKSVPQPAKSVDLDRYLGRWHELARYENSFEKGCEGVTADYAKRSDGTISVLNTCRQGSVDGPVKVAKGRAKVVPDAQNAKLKVSFFGPFYGDYWVLDHADDYSWSIVGEPSGRYLWYLARHGRLTAEDIQNIKARTAALGYDVSLLKFAKQPAS